MIKGFQNEKIIMSDKVQNCLNKTKNTVQNLLNNTKNKAQHKGESELYNSAFLIGEDGYRRTEALLSSALFFILFNRF